MAPGIQIKSVRYCYPDGKLGLDGVEISIERGEYLFICGANGSGKSTFAFLLNGLIPHFFGGILEGDVDILGKNVRNVPVSEFFPGVGMVLQNADAQLFSSTVEEELAFGLESLGFHPLEIRRKIDETASTFDIASLLKRSPDQLSGGEKRLVGVASISCLAPSIIVLDEPYANLDQDSVMRVRENLKNLHNRGITVVVAEQRFGECMEDAQRCIVMEKGKVRFDGAPSEAEKMIRRLGLTPDYSDCSSSNRIVRRKRSVTPIEFNRNTPLVRVENLSRKSGGGEILKDVCLDIQKGEAVALVGKNGSGKTTLLKHLNGLYGAQSGRVFFNGKDVKKKPPSQMAALAGISFQNANDQFFKCSVRDELDVGLKVMRGDREGWLKKICNSFQLWNLLQRPPFRLSEGEKKRAAVCSILAMKPCMLVLDEPTAGQDGPSRKRLANILCRLNREGFTILVASHDLDFARAVADRWIHLEGGKVISDGPPEEIRRSGRTAFG